MCIFLSWLLFTFSLTTEFYLKQQGGNLLWIDALQLKLSQCPKQLCKRRKKFLSNKSFYFFTDAATFVYVNIFVRSFSKIDDVKMVRTELSCLIIQRVITIGMLCFLLYRMSLMKTCKIFLERRYSKIEFLDSKFVVSGIQLPDHNETAMEWQKAQLQRQAARGNGR